MIQELFETIRESCSRANWSRGVELSRANAVMGEQANENQVILKVRPAGALASRTVTLFLQEEDWSCDCSTSEDVCEHVAAGIIALRRARQEGKLLPETPASVARIRYLFSRVSGALHFARAFDLQGKIQIFEATLSAIQSGRMHGPPFLATPADLQVDLILGMRLNGWLPKEVLANLLDALVDSPDIQLDDQPVKASKEKIVLRCRLDDQGDGYRLSLQQDSRVTEVFSNGVVLCADTLCVLGETRLNARELAEWKTGKFYGPEQRVELFTKILPSLQDRVPIDLHTRRQPKFTRALPRMEIRVEREGDTLCVLPTLVYGNPAVARVDAGSLVLLGNELPQRDEVAEERIVRKMQTLGLAPGHRERFPGEKGVEFAQKLASWRDVVQGEAHRAFFLAAPVEPQLSFLENDFDLSFESREEGGRARVRHAHPQAVVRAWREGSSLVPLLEGGFAPLPREWLARYGDRISDLLAAKEGKEELPASALPDLAKLCESMERPPPPAFESLRPLLEGFQNLPETTLPADLTAQLRAYQKEGVRWLRFLDSTQMGALLADDMGLGKTLQALCALQPPALVVAPTSVLHNWVAECAKFRPSLKVCLYHGAQREWDRQADLTVTSYALLRLDIDRLAAQKWKTVFLDEAQAIKNPDSQVARAAYRLQGRFRIAMTGTPVENRLEELWSQFHFINPGLLGGRQDFEERYAKPIATGTPGAALRLRERIRPFVLRRLKREVAPELPPRTEVVLRCELSEDEKVVYDAIRAATREEVVTRLRAGGNVLAALEALLRLRQACCHSALIPGQEAESSSKVDLLVESLQEAVADGHKSLVFSQWTGLLDLIEPRLTREKIAFTRLDGSTRDRQGVVQAFQEESGPPVMLISLKAGGAGLNLTAADHVFLVDPWWNPAVEDQAADRAHRIGQERPVIIHRLVASGTVEERILALQGEKRALAEAALSGADRAASLTRDDLISLLE